MKVIDLFCGCGGLSKGLETAGHEIVAAYDAWPLAVETYNLNFKSHKAEQVDISNFTSISDKLSVRNFDTIVGGPPCQDFSSAGLREEGARANLTKIFAMLVATKLPKFFVMENVARSRTSYAYSEARALFKKAGYGLTEVTLDASRCGVPQVRKRFFCVGHRGASDNFLKNYISLRLSSDPMTVRDYMADELPLTHYYRHPRNYTRRAVFSVDEPAATIRGVNRPVPSGYTGHQADSASLDENIRPLTTYERSRIQTFPKDFKWLGSKTDIEQMIGNAVPVNLGKFIGDCLSTYEFYLENFEAA